MVLGHYIRPISKKKNVKKYQPYNQFIDLLLWKKMEQVYKKLCFCLR